MSPYDFHSPCNSHDPLFHVVHSLLHRGPANAAQINKDYADMCIRNVLFKSFKKKAAGCSQGKQPLEPIPVPIEAMAEVLSYLSRTERARLVLTNHQMAQIIVSGINAERRKVSPVFIPIPFPLTRWELRSSTPPRAGCWLPAATGRGSPFSL